MATIDTTQPVLGPAAPTPAKPAATKKGDELGKNEFLKLLVAQMKSQDPLNPMDGQQMAAQMAQFSTVEQLITSNDTLARIRELLSALQPAEPPAEGAEGAAGAGGTQPAGPDAAQPAA